ncbi:uncharacterized protein LOC110252897 [Exaiptasia diaphana]|uniref:Uncharacterized protein n=1 Tax=Exaiptasia diaphana TaxID=2652724 RepID=A0A913Y648_EXADI|nr:uncharacterized protein LOC110252897 [Exaiptasia diaphana]KXJ06712.1 hypothetical protein AC249_AIPGENE13807 [Exaiptasia diaphana]
MAAKFKFATGSASENTSRISTIKRSSPSQQVAMSYKELGLEEDVSLAPLPSKRRRRARKSAGSDKVRNSNDAEREKKREFSNENTAHPYQNDGLNNTGLLTTHNTKNSCSTPGHTEKLLDGNPENHDYFAKEETTNTFQEGMIHDISFSRNSKFGSAGKTTMVSSTQGRNQNSPPDTPEKPSLSIEKRPDSFQEDVCHVPCGSGTDLVLEQSSGPCFSKNLSSGSSADLRKSTNGASRGNVCDKTFARPSVGSSNEAPTTAVHSRAFECNIDSTSSHLPNNTYPSQNIAYPSQNIAYSKSNLKTAGNTKDLRTTLPLSPVCNAAGDRLAGSTVSSSSNGSAAAVRSTVLTQTANASGIPNVNYSANDTNSPAYRSTYSICSSTSHEVLANACVLSDSDASNSDSIAFDIPASPGVSAPTRDELAELYKQLENGDFQA